MSASIKQVMKEQNGRIPKGVIDLSVTHKDT